jgi:hypothetical protein
MDISIAKTILLAYGFTQKQLEVMTYTEIIGIAERLKSKFGA